MKTLIVQMQPDLVSGLDAAALTRELEQFGASSPNGSHQATERGNDDGQYINIVFSTDDLTTLWREVKAAFLEGHPSREGFARLSIITCEGSAGWDDYLLLHHFDESETLDLL